MVARTEDKLSDLARSLAPSEVVVLPADVTKEDRRRLLDHRPCTRLGGLDVLINNAGVASWAHFADSSEAILRRIMDVNFFITPPN